MFVCMVITYSMSKDQPGKVANRARSWSAEQKKMNIFLSSFPPENLDSRDGFGSSAPRQPVHLYNTQAECGAYFRDSSRFPRRSPFIYI